MSTAIAVVPADKFAIANPDVLQAIRDSLMPGEELTARDLARITCPKGGGTIFEVPGPAGTEGVKEVTGLLLAYQFRGAIWADEEMREGVPPAIRSDDQVTAELVCHYDELPDWLKKEVDEATDDEGIIQWKLLPSAKFEEHSVGSGKKTTRKRAKETALLFLALANDDPLPVLLQVPPTSLKAFRQFRLQLIRCKVPPSQAVIGVTAKTATNQTGEPYAKLEFHLRGRLDPDRATAISAQVRSIFGS